MQRISWSQSDGRNNLLNTAEGEIEVYKYLSSFSCSKNKDVEGFLHKHAINNEKRNFSRTKLIVDSTNDYIIGYYTLMIKDFDFLDNVSKTTRKALTNNKNASNFISLLIAQLGKSDMYKHKVPGEIILQSALETCKNVFDLTALQMVSVEHSSHPNLKHFYQSNQFKYLQTSRTGNILSFLKLS